MVFVIWAMKTGKKLLFCCVFKPKTDMTRSLIWKITGVSVECVVEGKDKFKAGSVSSVMKQVRRILSENRNIFEWLCCANHCK